MSRSGYTDDYDEQWRHTMWRGAVASAIKGKRGQAFLRELISALDALPDKQLIAYDLEVEGGVCAIGSVGKMRGVDMSKLDPEWSENIAKTFGVSDALVREIEFVNDEMNLKPETPEERWQRVRRWAVSNLAASAIEARSDATTKIGAAEGESAVAAGETPKSHPDTP